MIGWLMGCTDVNREVGIRKESYEISDKGMMRLGISML